MIEIDHIGITSRNALESARALAEILGAPEPIADGADGDMYRVDLGHSASLLFSTSETINVEHIAFRVASSQFAEVITRLQKRGVSFGNDPEDPRNGKTDDPLGGAGRVYFIDVDGHLFEVVSS
jgi:catechol 2,3-dioxygenase-like lactoylglutathione lyase family enzyme